MKVCNSSFRGTYMLENSSMNRKHAGKSHRFLLKTFSDDCCNNNKLLFCNERVKRKASLKMQSHFCIQGSLHSLSMCPDSTGK